jgi:hypothetical protein
MGESFPGEEGCGERFVRRNINWGSSFASASGLGPFLPLINMVSPIIDQVDLSIIDIKILQCIKTV